MKEWIKKISKFWQGKTGKIDNNQKDSSENIESDNNLYKFKLTSYGEVTYVAKILLKKKRVLIDLEGLEQGEKKRILDFLSGVIFFQEGKAKRVKESIYYFFLSDSDK